MGEGDDVFPEAVNPEVAAYELPGGEEDDDAVMEEFAAGEGTILVADGQPDEGQNAKLLREKYRCGCFEI